MLHWHKHRQQWANGGKSQSGMDGPSRSSLDTKGSLLIMWLLQDGNLGREFIFTFTQQNTITTERPFRAELLTMYSALECLERCF